MRFMVPFLFVLGCWSGGDTKVVYKTKAVTVYRTKPVTCRICVDDKDDFCLPRLPVYGWAKNEAEQNDMRMVIVKWISYASECLGVEYQDVGWIISEGP